MFIRTTVLVALIGLIAWLAPASHAFAQSGDDDATDARYKYFIRFSAGKTKSSEIEGLTEPGKKLLDFYFDLLRNRKVLRKRAEAEKKEVVELPYMRISSSEKTFSAVSSLRICLIISI